MLGQDHGFSHDGHEVGVALPARNNMEVQMPGNARAGNPPQIHADVKAGGLDRLREQMDRLPEG